MNTFLELKNIFEKNSEHFIKGNLSNATRGGEFNKVKIKPLIKNEKIIFYTEKFSAKQAFQKNYNLIELLDFLENNIGKNFKNALFEFNKETLTILTNKKGETKILRKKNTQNAQNEQVSSIKYNNFSNTFFINAENEKKQNIVQNRSKNYILKPDVPVEFLIHLGVMTKTGKIVAQKYDKFKQINRFLEFIDDILPNILAFKAENEKQTINVVDFGCGKSYLTFALYHYLVNLKNLNAFVTGLDLKESVINFCNNLANEFNYKNLHFSTGNIANYKENAEIDLMVCLHACDTATDFALQKAVKSNAKAILCVPCCQHEINALLKKEKVLPQFELFLKYGIIKERFATLATDLMRAELLENAGYDVQLLEFIDMSHTPKNLLIRATKKKNNCSKSDTNSYTILKNALGVSPTLEKLI